MKFPSLDEEYFASKWNAPAYDLDDDIVDSMESEEEARPIVKKIAKKKRARKA